jgi:hypothetical protein
MRRRPTLRLSAFTTDAAGSVVAANLARVIACGARSSVRMGTAMRVSAARSASRAATILALFAWAACENE